MKSSFTILAAILLFHPLGNAPLRAQQSKDSTLPGLPQAGSQSSDDYLARAQSAVDSAMALAASAKLDAEGQANLENLFRPSFGRNPGRTVILSWAHPDPDVAAGLEEDLTIMSRILVKALGTEQRKTADASVMGIWVSSAHSSRAPQCYYLEGFGPLFLLDVRFPLVAPLDTTEHKTDENDDSTWEDAKRDVYGSREMSGGWGEMLFNHSDRQEIAYDGERVAALEKQLLEALKSGVHIRKLKPDDSIAIAVFGPDATAAARLKSGRQTKERAGANAGFPKPPLPPSPRATSQSTLTIRVKAHDVEAFAKGKLTPDEFRQKASIAKY